MTNVIPAAPGSYVIEVDPQLTGLAYYPVQAWRCHRDYPTAMPMVVDPASAGHLVGVDTAREANFYLVTSDVDPRDRGPLAADLVDRVRDAVIARHGTPDAAVAADRSSLDSEMPRHDPRRAELVAATEERDNLCYERDMMSVASATAAKERDRLRVELAAVTKERDRMRAHIERDADEWRAAALTAQQTMAEIREAVRHAGISHSGGALAHVATLIGQRDRLQEERDRAIRERNRVTEEQGQPTPAQLRDVPPANVLARRITPSDVAAYPAYFLYGPGLVLAETTDCPHGYRLTDSCPGCGSDEDSGRSEPSFD